ncbi:MAG: OmpA family protein [Bdellovibrionales bacterium]|nr:OmpA family protein [Bdellovibrionales bacterium]
MSSDKEEWIGVSDIMSGLMMVFLFISILFMQQVQDEKKSIEHIALTYIDYQEQLQRDLLKEFEPDLTAWNAEILKDSTIRFNEPDILFDQGSNVIKPEFKRILTNFFPRYIKVLGSQKHRERIDEIRIEGHTSSKWSEQVSFVDRYLKNAALSQRRSFSILEFCFALPQVGEYQEWLTKVLRANGLAFAKPIYTHQTEDYARSRRVEFRALTKAEEKIKEIIENIENKS